MYTGPRSLRKAEKYYGPYGGYFDDECAYPVWRYRRDGNSGMDNCHNKPGHGKDKIFCKQHARMIEKEK